jgi:hypothetical protein
MTEQTRELKGANMDIDLLPNPKVSWEMDNCPWNEADGTDVHKCAVKNVSLCEYFRAVKKPDIVICAYVGDSK